MRGLVVAVAVLTALSLAGSLGYMLIEGWGLAGVRVVALKRAGESIRIVPDPALPFGIGDHLVVIGERDPLQALAVRSRAPGTA